MKKYFLIPFFSLFIIFLFPFYSSAEFMPPVLPDQQSTSLVTDFLTTIAVQEMADNGVLTNNNEFNRIYELVYGHPISQGIQATYYDLGSVNWDTGANFYNSNGDIVPQQDTTLGFYSSDVGTVSFVFDSSTGEILRQGDSFEDSYSTIMSGKYVSDQERLPIASTLPELIEMAENQNYVYYPVSITDDIKESFESYSYSGYLYSRQYDFVTFVPNGCTSSCRIAPVDGEYSCEWSGSVPPPNGVNLYFFCNNETDVVQAGEYDPLKSYNSYYDDTYYLYCAPWYQSWNPFNNGGECAFKAPTDEVYDLVKNTTAIYVEPTDPENHISNIINYDLYNINLPDHNHTVNNSYNYNYPISDDNYPVSNTVSFGDYNPTTNNYISNYYNYYQNPSQGELIGSVDPNEITNNIPILNNLSRRFPFSIPFDLYNLAQGLSVPRETPYIDTTIIIPGVNYSWHIQYDLHSFDKTAELFRLLELILFIVGLAIFSYDHFFGS